MSGVHGAINSFAADVSAWAQGLRLPGGRKAGGKQSDGPSPKYIILAAVVCVVFPFDIYQLVFMLMGAFGYWLVQTGPSFRKKKACSPPPSPKAYPVLTAEQSQAPWRRSGWTDSPFGAPVQRQPSAYYPARPASGNGFAADEKVVKSVTMKPIDKPVFESCGFDAEVDELLSKIKPSPESIRAVEHLACRVQRCIRQVIPEAEVAGFSSSDFRQTKAFGVAVPEVDVVITVNPADLAMRCQGRQSPVKIDLAKLHKSAIRLCAEKLVQNGSFKFRRSAFRGMEPKVTLLAVQDVEEAIPLDLSVNSSLPFHNAALLAECERMDPRAKELILLVRRWAKDRGVCHAAKGHLSPYLWSILAIYFLQLEECSEGPLLPSLDFFELPPALLNAQKKISAKWCRPECTRETMSVASLFKAFVRFYGGAFDWSKEAVSVSQARRSPPSVTLAGQCDAAGPIIEDPFDASRNLGSCMNAASFLRLQEELARANKLCNEEGASLTELLELWSPPDEPEPESRAA